MKKDSVKVSVITAIYNQARYIEDYFTSLKMQTLQDFEVICVEDCSADDSLNQLKRLTQGDSRFRVIQNQQNSGLSVSRNKAMEMSKGKYICFLDGDDCLEDVALEVLFQTAEEAALQGVLYSAAEYKEDLEEIIRNIQYKEEYPICNGKTLMSLAHKRGEYQSAAGFQFWRRDFLMENRLFFVPGIVYEDTIFTIQALCRAERITAIPNILYHYRRCNTSISHNLGTKQLFSCIYIYETLVRYLEEYKDDTEVYPEIQDRKKLFEKRIQHIVCTMDDDYELDFHNEKYREIYLRFKENIQFPFMNEPSPDDWEKIENAENVFIFGDGPAAEETIAYLRKRNIFAAGIIVSDSSCKEDWNGFKRVCVQDFKEKGLVVIAVGGKWRESIEQLLAQKGNQTVFVGK